ncbi:hypothetical protein FOS14_22725 [Skermania sp. ID1734]|uniref:hypothetical protein n=1 Tax=Skermania sp. ID1734 TaxID=2597516 RepID=UPI00117D8CE2|nr:hypothetical protein [Skermania sp. ID1734]TSD93671.1 hypothetical protein FOS14_22725 [Skermania sp. ID1734]
MAAQQFRLNASSLTYAQQDGVITVGINLEGEAGGFGPTLGTLSATPANANQGRWQWVGVSFPGSGDSKTGLGSGAFRKISSTAWQLDGDVDISGGDRLRLDAEFDLMERVFAGQLS